MQLTRGDIFKMEADAIGVTTNGMTRKDGTAVMGAGIAKTATILYPGIDRVLGELLKETGNRVYLLHQPHQQPWPQSQVAIFSFPTKQHWRQPSLIPLIEASAHQLVELADRYQWQRIVLPQPGCGLGGLNWESDVAPVLEPIFDQRFIISAGL